MKKKLRTGIGLATGISLLILGVSSVCNAYPLPTNWLIKYNNVEVVNPAPDQWVPGLSPVQSWTAADTNEDNWGVAQITSIIDRVDNSVKWSTGDNGEHLRMVFGGLAYKTVTAIDTNADFIPDSFNIDLIDATNIAGGSFLDIYLHKEGDAGYQDYDITGGPAARIGSFGYPTISDGAGVLQASFDFAPGISAADSAQLTDVDQDTLTGPFTGDGTGYLELIANTGPLSDILGTDGFVTPHGLRDVFLEFDFRPHPDVAAGGGLLPDYGWTVNSEDPAFGTRVQPIPEPATMFLLGTGLVGVAGAARRRKKNQA